jgi:hypothetical protein
LKILSRNTNTAAIAAPIKTTKAMAATGELFAGGGVLAEFAIAAATGRSPVFVPVMMYFGSSVAGACGTVIFWKHVGHSITEPACDESHLMCCPHTGQAYLNSLMLGENISHPCPFGNADFLILLVLVLNYFRLRGRG